jgi:methionyl-tRNA formyltransferase
VTVVAEEAGQEAAPGTILSIEETKGLRIACKGNSVIRADIIFTEEGFLPGFALAGLGLQPGMQFN